MIPIPADHSKNKPANPMSFCLRRRAFPLLPRSSERILPQVSILSKDFHLRTDIKKEPCNSKVPCGIRQRPTLPGRLQPSTIGAERLNFCVRYGNRWIPFAVATGIVQGLYPENRTSSSLTSRSSYFLMVFGSSPRPISIIKLQTLLLFHR